MPDVLRAVGRRRGRPRLRAPSRTPSRARSTSPSDGSPSTTTCSSSARSCSTSSMCLLGRAGDGAGRHHRSCCRSPWRRRQCRRFLRQHLPGAPSCAAANSTAEAARLVGEDAAAGRGRHRPRGRRRPLRARGPGRRHRGPPRQPDPLRRRRPRRRARADRPRQDQRRHLPAGRRAGQPDLDPPGVRGPQHQPLQAGVPAHQGRRPRRLLLRHRPRRPHRRRAGGRRACAPSRPSRPT